MTKQITAKLLANISALERYPQLLAEMKEVKEALAKFRIVMLSNAQTINQNPTALNTSIADMSNWPEMRNLKIAIERARILEGEIKLLQLIPANTALA